MEMSEKLTSYQGTKLLYQCYVAGKDSINSFQPTVFENYTIQLAIDGKTIIDLYLSDTAGQETYGRLRKLSYQMADVFLIIFSVVDPTSFENATNKWYQDLNDEDFSKVPKILVGNEIEKRDPSNPNHIKQQTAKQISEQLGLQYFECSSQKTEGINEIIEEAARKGYKYKMNNTNSQNHQIEQPNQPNQKDKHCIIS